MFSVTQRMQQLTLAELLHLAKRAPYKWH